MGLARLNRMQGPQILEAVTRAMVMAGLHNTAIKDVMGELETLNNDVHV